MTHHPTDPIAEVQAALKPSYMLALSRLVQAAQQDHHPLADAAGSTGPYVVQGCVVYGAEQLREAVRTIWTTAPALLSELEAAQARLDKARALHKPQRRYLDSAKDGETSFDFANDAAEFYETAIGDVTFFEVCAHCGDLEMYDLEERRDYRDSLWPCKTARALGLGEGADDA